MVGMLNNISADSQFRIDDLKTSDASSVRKAEDENQSNDKLHAKDDEKRFDSFEHQEQTETARTYRVTKDNDGKLKVIFDGASNVSDSGLHKGSSEVKNTDKKADVVDNADENNKTVSDDKIDEKDKVNTDDKVNSKNEDDKEDEEPTIVVTTFDLSAVEREIKQLKQQQQQLQRELSSATEEQKQQIQAELDRVTQELEKKDTDAYRNSHDNRRQYTLN